MSNKRNRRSLALAQLAVVILAAGLAYFERDGIGDKIAPPPTIAVAISTPAQMSDDEVAFYSYVGPRMASLAAESRVLAQMGEQRSRDIAELQIRSSRVGDLLTAIAGYVRDNGVPERFTELMGIYETGAAQLSSGRDQATKAVLSFDWADVASGLAKFTTGADDVERAVSLLRGVATQATPAPD